MKTNQAIEQFLSSLQGAKSPRTIIAYRTALLQFCESCGDINTKGLLAIHVAQFCQSLKVSASTRNTYLTAVARFVRWLLMTDNLGMDALEYARFTEQMSDLRAKRTEPLPRVPDEGDVQALLKNARGHSDLRAVALVETLRSTGARIGEVVALRVDDLRAGTATVTGKGQKQRLVYFDDVAWDAIQAHVEAQGSVPGNFVFQRKGQKSGNHLSTHSARVILRGMGTDITPHQMRHRFGTRVLGATGNLAATQDLLGHASPVTTRRYARITGNGLQEAHAQAGV